MVTSPPSLPKEDSKPRSVFVFFPLFLTEMAGRFEGRHPTHRGVEQAIVALKKGAHLLKCGRRGKPKFCPFRLSSDEKMLIWYSKENEKHLSLSSVSNVVLGQKTPNFLRHHLPEKESQSLSLIYENGECSLDLICKDKEQAECWYLGLTILISASHNPKPLADSRSSRRINSCANSPPSYIQRKSRLAIIQGTTNFPQVHSLYGSPRFVQNRFLENRLDFSEAFFSPRQKTWSDMDLYFEKITPQVLDRVRNGLKDMTIANKIKEHQLAQTPKVKTFDQGTHAAHRSDSLKDIFIWGDVLGGMLDGGDGLKANISLPRLLDSTQMLDVQNIACGQKHAAIVTKQGEVFCWGEESGGRLGHKISTNVSCPKIVESLTSTHVKTIAFGAKHTCAVTSSCELYEWGEGTHSLGLSDDQNQRSQWFPHKLCGPLDGISVCRVACGEWHTAVVSSSGQLFTYGDGTFGVLGHGNTQSISRPKEVSSLKGLRVKSVSCGPWHTAAIVEIIGSFKSNIPGGKLFTWGDADRGKLGHADKTQKLLPTCVESLVDCDFVQVSCGTMLTVALTITGVVFAIGSSIHGQLGNLQAVDGSIATVEGLLKTEFVKEISSGSFHVAVLTTNGKVFTWGKGADGQLGLGDYADRSSPAPVEALEERYVENIACGSNFTAAICLHKSISSKDQSACSECRMVFGFTRKKHNCYNCGSVFCNSCSSNKVAKAALAPDKSKRYRVCDACFSQLQKVIEPSKVNSELKTDKEETFFTETKVYTPKLSRIFKEANFIKEKMASAQGANQSNQDLVPPVNGRDQRWGQVECPTRFNCARENIQFHPTRKHQMSENSCVQRKHQPIVSKSVNSLPQTADCLKEELHVMEKILSEEIKQLREQVTVLAEQCQHKSLKVQLYKRKVEETWLIVRDEAAKCKAAKDIIKVLTNQRNALSAKLSAAQHLHNTKIMPNSISGHPAQAELPDPPDKKLVTAKFRQLNDVRPLHSRRVEKESMPPSSNAVVPLDGYIGETDATMAPIESNGVIEQIERGVYVTFITLPGGNKDIKRVRFSRKHFGEKEAEKWWEENHTRVFTKYNIEQMVMSSPNQTEP